MFEVHTSSGMLRNTDSGNPMVPIGQPPSSLPTLHLPHPLCQTPSTLARPCFGAPPCSHICHPSGEPCKPHSRPFHGLHLGSSHDMSILSSQEDTISVTVCGFLPLPFFPSSTPMSLPPLLLWGLTQPQASTTPSIGMWAQTLLACCMGQHVYQETVVAVCLSASTLLRYYQGVRYFISTIQQLVVHPQPCVNKFCCQAVFASLVERGCSSISFTWHCSQVSCSHTRQVQTVITAQQMTCYSTRNPHPSQTLLPPPCPHPSAA